MHFGPQKDLFIQKLWKKLCSTQKVCLIKVSSEYSKNAKGEKLEPPKRLNFMILGPQNFFPWPFFLYSEGTFKANFLSRTVPFMMADATDIDWGP